MTQRRTFRNAPPLPFPGNKACSKKIFQQIIHDIKDGNKKTFIDLFGGSFFLSYLIHLKFPMAKIICNDFDGYKERLDNIKDTIDLLGAIRNIIKEERFKILADTTKAEIIDLITNFEGYKDMTTLSYNLIYSNNPITNFDDFSQHDFYNLLPKNEYDSDISDYIEGIEFRSCSWEDLYKEFKGKNDCVFIADPPNLRTWSMSENLKVLDLFKEKEFLYYCSTKSGLNDFINYLKDKCKMFPNFETIPYKKNNKELILFRLEKAEEVKKRGRRSKVEKKVKSAQMNIDALVEHLNYFHGKHVEEE